MRSEVARGIQPYVFTRKDIEKQARAGQYEHFRFRPTEQLEDDEDE